MAEQVKVLVLAESSTQRETIGTVLRDVANVRVVGECGSLAGASRLALTAAPHVIVIAHSEHLDAIAATAAFMATTAAPIIVVAAPTAIEGGPRAAKEVGAVGFIAMPQARGPEQTKALTELAYLVLVMAEVKVVTRRRSLSPPKSVHQLKSESAPRRWSSIRVVAIGASSGGPQALTVVLAGLPADFDLPVLIVQHLSTGFQDPFVEYLASHSRLPVRVAADADPMRPGNVYVAPDDYQMGVDSAHRIVLRKAPPERGLRPSVSYMFRSVQAAFGSHCVAVLLTGMGRDGAAELAAIRAAGAVTIAQDEASSAVFGMPKEAIALGGARHILPLNDIAPTLADLAKGGS